MITTQKKAFDACNVIAKLCTMSLDVYTSYKLLLLRKKLEVQTEFQINEEMKIINELDGAKVDDEGRIAFKSIDDRIEFESRRNDLFNLEIFVDVEPIQISFASNPDIRLSADELENLTPFITFTELTD